jgi:acetyltransferase-like isoleucine patch superfamily enzyme
MDTDFHRVESDRRTSTLPPRVAPVRIGANVWIAHQAGILPGAWIGDNSVVSFGSVCTRAYPANAVLVGNPAKVAASVPDTASAPPPVALDR